MTTAAAKLTVAEAEKAIGIPVDQWSGNCYAIACAILRARLVKGRPAYGHWTGPVHPQSPFRRGGNVPFQRHGWIVLEERGPHAQRPGAVMDPTRWVFEHVAPYIYVGAPAEDTDCVDCGYTEDEHDDDDTPTCGIFVRPDWPYDEGGDRFRMSVQRPLPQRKDGDKVQRLDLPRKLKQRLGLPQRLTVEQMAWLANLPYSVMGRDAWAICQALAAAGHKAYIPIDTWTRADAERGLSWK